MRFWENVVVVVLRECGKGGRMKARAAAMEASLRARRRRSGCIRLGDAEARKRWRTGYYLR